MNRLSDVGAASCRTCGLLVAMLRAELSYTPGVAPAVHWSEAGRQCRCATTRLPGAASLPSAVRVRLRDLGEAAASARPWEQLAARAPLHLLV
ncbi:hypothetical protein G7075_13385 [Phycicoccus sp. HDW14]|uniref:hypothetical protein n=1 Tax=Phycicoccus sp. HDW14 TaxID=2714941 RepID=UPI00140ACC23|nr:hypothetical protein [Phycicoccus sp. HDW14]QIM21886.1 hypothetical protein G7075_13385 [Phycicoccus sp. HDW14]